jgi:hypothetical protein
VLKSSSTAVSRVKDRPQCPIHGFRGDLSRRHGARRVKTNSRTRAWCVMGADGRPSPRSKDLEFHPAVPGNAWGTRREPHGILDGFGGSPATHSGGAFRRLRDPSTSLARLHPPGDVPPAAPRGPGAGVSLALHLAIHPISIHRGNGARHQAATTAVAGACRIDGRRWYRRRPSAWSPCRETMARRRSSPRGSRSIAAGIRDPPKARTAEGEGRAPP